MEVVRILSNNFFQAMKWSDRNRIFIYDLKDKIRNYLNSLSGNDIVSMLNDILDVSEKEELSIKYIDALKNMSKAVNDVSIVSQKKKHNFIRPLRQSGITFSQAKEFGFQFGSILWKSCLNDNERNLGGRPLTSNNIISKIKKHMEKYSTIGANRMVKIRTFSERNCGKLCKCQI